MYAKGTPVELEIEYKTGMTDTATVEIEKEMTEQELFDVMEELMKDFFLLKRYRVSVADRWSRWHYVA